MCHNQVLDTNKTLCHGRIIEGGIGSHLVMGVPTLILICIVYLSYDISSYDSHAALVGKSVVFPPGSASRMSHSPKLGGDTC